MGKEPRGVFHLLEPSLQRAIRKNVRVSFSKLIKLHLENFVAIRRAQRTVELILYGAEYGKAAFELQQRDSKKR